MRWFVCLLVYVAVSVAVAGASWFPSPLLFQSSSCSVTELRSELKKVSAALITALRNTDFEAAAALKKQIEQIAEELETAPGPSIPLANETQAEANSNELPSGFCGDQNIQKENCKSGRLTKQNSYFNKTAIYDEVNE